MNANLQELRYLFNTIAFSKIDSYQSICMMYSPSLYELHNAMRSMEQHEEKSTRNDHKESEKINLDIVTR